MASHHDKSLLHRIGCQVSSWVSDVAAHPFAQIGVILFCALWWIFKLPTDILTAGLSILAITLTQMVLNRQNEREADDHRRDVAMHAKLDELLISQKGARDEMAGIEEMDEEDIAELKEEVKKSIEDAGPSLGDEQDRHIAERAAENAVDRATRRGRAGTG